MGNRQADLQAYSNWVRIAGIYNFIIGVPLAIPVLYKQYYKTNNMINRALHLGGVEAVPPKEGANQFFVNLAGLLLCGFGLSLLYASRDIANRSGIPVINAITRTTSVALILYYTAQSNMARVLALFGTVDLLFSGIFIYYAAKIRGRRT